MATDLSNITASTQLASSLGNIGLVMPQNNVGIIAKDTGDPAFYFHFEAEQSVDLDMDITDHYIEDNTAIHDQAALKPEIVQTEGFIGEVTDLPALGDLANTLGAGSKVVGGIQQSNAYQKLALQKLVLLAPMMPQVSISALVAYNTAAQAAAVAAGAAKSTATALRTISGKDVQNAQQRAYAMFKKYRKDRRLFTVQTPWEIYTDMLPWKIRATQDKDTQEITSFKITFKQIRFAKTAVVNKPIADGRAAAQNSSVVDQGSQVPTVGAGLADQLTASGLA